MLGGIAISDALLTFTNYWIDPVPFILVAFVLQPLWAWRRLEAIVSLVEDKASALQQFQSSPVGNTDQNKSREVVLKYAKLLDRAVDSARSELDFLTSVIDEMPDAVAIFDQQNELLLSNQKIKQLLGTEHLSTETSLTEFTEHLQVPLKTFLNEVNHPLIKLATTQGIQEFFLKTTTIQSPSGGDLRLVILTDITELRQSQTQRDRALQFLSHDMRTPVASILSLTRRGIETAEAGEQREKIVHHAKALLNMMDDFILTVSAEAPRYQFKQELLDNLLNDAIEQVADLAEAKNIRLIDQSDATSIFVMANTRLLVRALVNLLFNAIKFSPQSSNISIQARYVQDTKSQSSIATVTIQNPIGNDTAPDLIPSMPGFGLGLDFVDTVVQKHQGHITRDIPKSGTATLVISIPCTIN